MNKIEALDEKALDVAVAAYHDETRPNSAISSAIGAYLTASDAEREPVAWMWRTNWTGEKWHFAAEASFSPSDLERGIVHSVVPLYAAHLPLTDLEAENARLREERKWAREKALEERRAANDYAARLAQALKALDAIIERSNNDPLGTSKVNDMRRIAEEAARRVREGRE